VKSMKRTPTLAAALLALAACSGANQPQSNQILPVGDGGANASAPAPDAATSAPAAGPGPSGNAAAPPPVAPSPAPQPTGAPAPVAPAQNTGQAPSDPPAPALEQDYTAGNRQGG
jgi:hypothetical protein